MEAGNDGLKSPAQDVVTSCSVCRSLYADELKEYRTLTPESERAVELMAVLASRACVFFDDVTEVDGACSHCKHHKDKHGKKPSSIILTFKIWINDPI